MIALHRRGSCRVAGISRTDVRGKSPARRDALLDRISTRSRVASRDVTVDCDHQDIPGLERQYQIHFDQDGLPGRRVLVE
jgi:hypothetical protein